MNFLNSDDTTAVNVYWSDDESNKNIDNRRCKYCFETVVCASELSIHIQNCEIAVKTSAETILWKDGTERFICDLCLRPFKYFRALVEHEIKHKPPGGFQCKFCDARFCSRNDRENHTTTIHKVFKCQICTEIFPTADQYTYHIKNKHKGQDKTYRSCEKCQRQFSSTKHFQYHLETNCGKEKHFKCNECDKKFLTKYTLKTHKLNHSGKTEYCCSYCGLKFVLKGPLMVHERKHTGEKPFKCNICEKTFSHRPSLVTHSSVHTGIKPYYCVCCNLKFSCTGNLIAHRKKRPDTCGQPEYCTKLDKICPLPSIYNIEILTSDEPVKLNKSYMVFNIDEQEKLKKCTPSNDIKESIPINDVVKIEKTNAMQELLITEKTTVAITIPNKNLYSTVPKENVNENQYQSIQENDNRKDLNIIQIKSEKIEITLKQNESVEENKDCVNVKKLNGGSRKCYKVINPPRRSPRNKKPLTQFIEIIEDRKKLCGVTDSMADKSNFDKLNIVEGTKIENTLNISKIVEDSQKTAVTKDRPQKGHFVHCNDNNEQHVEPSMSERTLIAATEVENHIKVEHNDDLCEKTFKSLDSMNRHNSYAHSDKSNKESVVNRSKRKNYQFICTKCGKVFTSATFFKNHEQSDCGKNPMYRCDICGKSLSTAGILKTHMFLHSNVYPYKCSFCGKDFRTKYRCNDHEKVHTGEKPFKCTHCEQGFAHRSNLFNHLSIHTGIKRFLCNGCGDRFSCISGLKSHWRVHAKTCGTNPNKSTKPEIYMGFQKGKLVTTRHPLRK